mmetsp:Transcript_35510/g.86484  ORF Transcript_35510/g.86484 Transcript_35510/m.86484 type:complete len:324 (+) Transcript_35510:405-1376(+)
MLKATEEEPVGIWPSTAPATSRMESWSMLASTLIADRVAGEKTRLLVAPPQWAPRATSAPRLAAEGGFWMERRSCMRWLSAASFCPMSEARREASSPALFAFAAEIPEMAERAWRLISSSMGMTSKRLTRLMTSPTRSTTRSSAFSTPACDTSMSLSTMLERVLSAWAVAPTVRGNMTDVTASSTSCKSVSRRFLRNVRESSTSASVGMLLRTSAMDAQLARTEWPSSLSVSRARLSMACDSRMGRLARSTASTLTHTSDPRVPAAPRLSATSRRRRRNLQRGEKPGDPSGGQRSEVVPCGRSMVFEACALLTLRYLDSPVAV